MTLSTGPWWWAPVFAFGWMITVPAQSFSAPARARVIAAARFMPGVCGVLMSSSFAWTTRTPRCFHLDSALMSELPGSFRVDSLPQHRLRLDGERQQPARLVGHSRLPHRGAPALVQRRRLGAHGAALSGGEEV